jgi:hypothetical protein
MNFVGPRPLMPNKTELRDTRKPVPIEEIPGYLERHRIIPPLTENRTHFAEYERHLAPDRSKHSAVEGRCFRNLSDSFRQSATSVDLLPVDARPVDSFQL